MPRTTIPQSPEVLYETQRNRATGSHTAVIDLRPKGKYALVCFTHKVLVERDNRLDAESESHKPATWCKHCTGEHVPPAKGERVEIDKATLRRVYLAVVRNWAVSERDVANALAKEKAGELERKVVHRALQDLVAMQLLVAEHVNGERSLTYQSYFDVDNDEDALKNARKAFNEATK